MVITIRLFSFVFVLKQTHTKQIFCFIIIQSSTSNTVSFNIFLNDRDNDVFIIGSIIAIVNPDTIKDYMNGVPIIV